MQYMCIYYTHTRILTNIHVHRFSFLGHLSEVTGGLTSVRAAPTLLHTAENDWTRVYTSLQRIRTTLLKRSNTIVNLTADKKTLAKALNSINTITNKLPTTTTATTTTKPLLQSWLKVKPDKLLGKKNEGYIVPSQINYVSFSISINIVFYIVYTLHIYFDVLYTCYIYMMLLLLYDAVRTINTTLL